MDKNISEYIEKQKSPQREICLKLREIIFKAVPGIDEKMRWGVPSFGGGKFYLVALKDHVNIGFAVGGLAQEEAELFEGRGKTMRHIKVWSLEGIDREKLEKLIKMVEKKSVCGSC